MVPTGSDSYPVAVRGEDVDTSLGGGGGGLSDLSRKARETVEMVTPSLLAGRFENSLGRGLGQKSWGTCQGFLPNEVCNNDERRQPIGGGEIAGLGQSDSTGDGIRGL